MLFVKTVNDVVKKRSLPEWSDRRRAWSRFRRRPSRCSSSRCATASNLKKKIAFPRDSNSSESIFFLTQIVERVDAFRVHVLDEHTKDVDGFGRRRHVKARVASTVFHGRIGAESQ